MINKKMNCVGGVMLAMLLAGCIANPVVKNNSVPLSLNPTKAIGDQNEKLTVPVAAQKKATPSATNQNSSLVASGQLDWSKLFKSWEDGCTDSPEANAFFNQFVMFGKDGYAKLGKVNLPSQYKLATGTPFVSTPAESGSPIFSFILPVTTGSYYGIPVKAIEQYVGDSNGYSGKRLFLNASENVVRQVLNKQKVSFKKRKDLHAMIVKEDAKVTVILCNLGE